MTAGKKNHPLLPLFLFFILATAILAKADDGAANKSPAAFSVKITGTGRPMILIPGLSCSGDVWDGTVAHFKDHYECHVMTLAGFAGQPAVSAPFMEQVRAGIVKYIREKKLDHPVIVGHSLGGFMAYWVAETAPDQVGPVIAVDGLPFLSLLFNPAATVESSRAIAEQFRARYDSQSPEAFVSANRMALEGMITNPKNVEAVEATSRKSDPKAVGEAVYELMITDLRPGLSKIQSPVLLIGSTQSVAASEALYRTEVAAIPNHKVVFAPKARHFVQLDDPQFFYSQAESFLKDAGPAGTK